MEAIGVDIETKLIHTSDLDSFRRQVVAACKAGWQRREFSEIFVAGERVYCQQLERRADGLPVRLAVKGGTVRNMAPDARKGVS